MTEGKPTVSTNDDPGSARRPLTLMRCWQIAGAHAEIASMHLSADGGGRDDIARAHAAVAQAYATLLAAGVAAHQGGSRPPAGALTALTRAMYDAEEV